MRNKISRGMFMEPWRILEYEAMYAGLSGEGYSLTEVSRSSAYFEKTEEPPRQYQIIICDKLEKESVITAVQAKGWQYVDDYPYFFKPWTYLVFSAPVHVARNIIDVKQGELLTQRMKRSVLWLLVGLILMLGFMLGTLKFGLLMFFPRNGLFVQTVVSIGIVYYAVISMLNLKTLREWQRDFSYRPKNWKIHRWTYIITSFAGVVIVIWMAILKNY